MTVSVPMRYAVSGALFGALFPVVSTLVQLSINGKAMSVDGILLIQQSTPLLWVIDSAPFWLGLFAWLAGRRQNRLVGAMTELTRVNAVLQDEILVRKIIDRDLRSLNRAYEEDLNSARLIQESFLPDVPSFPEGRMAYRYLPLKTVGGDFLSITALSEGGFGILIGDVIGHGLSAALITALAKVLSNKTCRFHAQEPGLYLRHLNVQVARYLPEAYYLTALFGRLKFTADDAEFTFARGAHPHPLVYRTAAADAQWVESRGMPLGFDETAEYEAQTVRLAHGDRLFLLTDGFLESRNADREFLGFERMRIIMRDVCRKRLALDETLDAIIALVEDYRGGIPVGDDRVLLGVEIGPSARKSQ